jgi:hypothetical protein
MSISPCTSTALPATTLYFRACIVVEVLILLLRETHIEIVAAEPVLCLSVNLESSTSPSSLSVMITPCQIVSCPINIPKARHQAALYKFAHYLANGDSQNESGQFEICEIKDALRLEFKHKQNGRPIELSEGERQRLLAIVFPIPTVPSPSALALPDSAIT